MNSTPKLEKLEALRGFAALYVVIHHFNLGVLNLPKYNIVSVIIGQGQAAVMLFFILSGFVIFLASHKSIASKRFSFRIYFVKRFRRIYPVFFGALLVAYIAACLNDRKLLPIDTIQLLGNILNLQDHPRLVGIHINSFFKNGPLWSLSYEWWFYMLFYPIVTMIRPGSQKYVVLGLSLAGFISYWALPNKISVTLEYFIIWWTGVELARSWINFGKISSKTVKFIVLSLLLFIILNSVQTWLYEGDISFRTHPVIQLRHFTYALLIISAGMIWLKVKMWGFDVLMKPFLVFAPISYGLYVFHAPLTFKNVLFSDNLIINYLIGFFIAVILSYLFEVVFQKRINRFSDNILRKMTRKGSLFHGIGILALMILLTSCEDNIQKNEKQYLFKGDSHINRWDLDRYFPLYSMENAGVNGSKIDDLIRNLKKDDTLNDKKIFIQIGTNDYMELARTENETAVDSLSARLMKLKSFIENELTPYNFCILSLIPLGKQAGISNSGTDYPTINGRLELELESSPIDFLNLSQFLEHPDGYLDEFLTSDGIHLNTNGYYVISNALRRHAL